MDFLCDSKKKEELFAFLTTKVVGAAFPSGNLVYITSGESVLHTGFITMPNYNHEEADTKIVVHIQQSLEQGMKNIEVRTVDTDVMIILVAAFYELVTIKPLADIWVAFGTGKNYCFLSINAIRDSLRERRAQALPVLHALTGCDTTSAFKGKGKKSAWQAWWAFEDVTDTFLYLCLHQFEILDAESNHFKIIGRLVVVLYNRTSS